MLVLPVFFFCFQIVTAQFCSKEATIHAVKKPIYDFSVRFLDRVSFETTGHFVYSPLTTWLQLISLAEGAKSETLKELWEVTGLKGFRKKVCYRRKLREILNTIEDNMTIDSQRQMAIIVDKLYKVKGSFKGEVQALNSMKVLSVDFDNPEESALEVNEILNSNIGYFKDIVLPNYFNQSVLLVTDVAYYKSAWKYPFNEAQTQLAPFYSNNHIEIGKVRMMNQVGYFNLVNMELLINAKVLELPCLDDTVSMLIFLPLKDSILDLYYLLKDTTLTGVLNKLKVNKMKPVNVSIPRFEIETEITNIRELLYDMGLRRLFYPEKAEFKGISDFTINVSLMTQLVYIEVTERGVFASSGPENLIVDTAEEFNANKPFGFMLVDKRTEIILFSGMYSEPSVV